MLRKSVSLGQFVSVLVIVGVLAVTGSVMASTTISTNVNTGGTLTVSGLSSLGQATSTMLSANSAYFGSTATTTISAAGALSVPALATFLGGATTTTLTLLNGEVISNATDGVIQLGGVASTTSLTLLNGETITNATDGTIVLTGGISVTGVSSFTGLATLLGGATTTSLTLLNGEVISNTTDGTISFGTADLRMAGTASTSAIKVGNGASPSTISGLVFGYCTLEAAAVSAATTTYASCTGATGVISGDRVFMQATSSLPVATIVTAASSTATAGTISVRFHATAGATDIDADTVSLNFWAVR